MNNSEQLTSVQQALQDIALSAEMHEHEERKRDAALRHLRARRGIEIHNEMKRLERDLMEYDEGSASKRTPLR